MVSLDWHPHPVKHGYVMPRASLMPDNDVGINLQGVKSTLNRLLKWHIKHPSSFSRLGLKFPKGVLLYGPSGCGKTTLANAVGSPGHGCSVKLSASMLFSKCDPEAFSFRYSHVDAVVG